MKMESPVRICLGAVLVVFLLLTSIYEVRSSTIPQETTPNILKDERTSRYSRFNSTLINNRNKPKIADVALNELNPKVTTSEENTEKNAKYKDRGRVKFNVQIKSSSETPLKMMTSTEGPGIIIITPTPEVKKPAQIIDSMHKYKKTKLPIKIVSSTSSSVSVKSETEDKEEFDDDEDGSFESFSSSKFEDDNFFSFPTFSIDNDDLKDKKGRKLQKKESNDYSTPFSFSNYFTRDNYESKENSYKSDFFDFDSDLTTPKNDFFDKKYQEISKSILNNLDTIKSKTPPLNITKNVHKINIDFEKPNNNNTPGNKSSVFIKNTKEIHYLDNDKAGSENKQLSDVQGTSIYYEMTVLSTETYNITNTNDDDCDDDVTQKEHSSKPTVVRATQPSIIEISTKDYIDSDARSASMSQASSNYLPESIPALFESQSPISISTQNTLSYSDSPTVKSKLFSSSYNRNKNYAKRLNFANHKDSPNSVTPQTEQAQGALSQASRQQIRRFHHTTPKTKPIWMAPRRNRTATRVPMTIYSEHFDIKDQFTSTTKPELASKPILTTFASEIDPVLQSDVSGIKKVVHSPSVSDNSIPTLWKRGSTKFSTSTATSIESQASINDLEIPPTLTAWALASLRSPPPASHTGTNVTTVTHKNDDENDLQNVGEIVDKKEKATSTTLAPATVGVNTYFVDKNITEIYQNKLPLKPIFTTTTISSVLNSKENATESFSERLPAESNISIQNSVEPIATESMKEEDDKITTVSSINESKPTWISATTNIADMTELESNKSAVIETIPPVDATKSTGFESITKLPSGVTTPKDELTIQTEDNKESVTKPIKLKTANDYEITTIRFSYIPTEDISKNTEMEETTYWHPVFPTRSKPTSVDDILITTYRPKYMTTELMEEISTIITEDTSNTESSSQVIDNTTKENIKTTETIEDSTVTTESAVTTEMPKETPVETTTMESTTPIETTTIVVTVATEINSEKGTVQVTEVPTTIYTTEVDSSETSNSEENSASNEVITQENKPIVSSTVESTTKSNIVTTTIATQTNLPTTTLVAKTTTTPEHDVNAQYIETTVTTSPDEITTEISTKSINDLEDITNFGGEMTTESSSRVTTEEAGSGAAIAITVSTIGVLALVLLIGLLLIVRRRGRRGVYAQRCTPVSLDAYSLDSVSIGHRKGNQRLRASKRSYGNPAYDDEVTSHPMNYAALANFALDIESITSEFAEIPSVTVRPEEVPPGCEDKNRYSNVLPLPETRVPLKRIGSDPTTEYINANYVTGPGNIRNFYILCQAPLANTVTDFWRMIWEQNSRLVVMLTEYMENGVEKCYEYLPPSEITDNRRTFGNFQIILKKREQRDKYAISSVQLINLATRTWREVTHLWYFWPAKGVPDDYDSVIDFLFEMRSYMKVSQTAKEYDEEGVEIIYEDENRSSFNNLSKLREENGSSNGMNVYSPARAEEKLRRERPTNGTLGKMKSASEIQCVRPCVVVCASGAGRSAALVAAEECARALAAGRADVPRAVRRLRHQRPHSLTNRHHYIFLYKLLSEYGNKLMGSGVDTI